PSHDFQFAGRTGWSNHMSANRMPSLSIKRLKNAIAGALAMGLIFACSCSLQSPPLPPPCYGPDNGQGTVNFPPSCGLGPIGPMNQPVITNGLNPGDSIILIDVNLLNLTPNPIMPGGTLGGDTQHSQGNLDVHLGGSGTLTGWDLHVPIRVDCQIDAG